MRLHPIFAWVIATLVVYVPAKLHGAGPVYTVSLESSVVGSRLDARDAPNNLDYRCGPKIGQCPVGTCCSGAGTCRRWLV